MLKLIIPFLCLALIGLVLSFVAHLAALLGLPQPLGVATFGLHAGIFVVWIPAIIVGQRLVNGCQPDDYWKATLRGCRPWMRWLAWGIFAYAILNFLTFLPFAPGKGQRNGPQPPAIVIRGFSGHWMAFYAMAAAVLYSALVVGRDESVSGRHVDK